MKSELLGLKMQTSDMHKFGDDFLRAIYFTVTTSWSKLHLKKGLQKTFLSWKSKAHLIIYYLRIKAHIRTVTAELHKHILLPSVTYLQVLPWLGQDFISLHYVPIFFQNRKQIMTLTWKLCQPIHVLFFTRKLCSQFLNRTAKNGACELVFRYLTIV